MTKTCICLSIALSVTAVASPPRSSGQSKAHSDRAQSTQHRTDMQNAKAKSSQNLSELLNYTKKARNAIRNKNKTEARQQIEQALNSANKVTNSGNSGQLVPLYSELDRYSVIGPIANSRTKSGAASGSGTADRSKSSSNTQNGTANTSNNASGSTKVAVNRVVGGYTSVALDVAAAKNHLQEAQQAIDKGDLKSADQHLQSVQDSVVIESVAADMPLLRARENLIMARDNADNGKYQQAQTQLHAASRALSDYANSDGQHKQDVQRMRSEIDSYSQSFAKSHSDADSRIESWWDQTTNWITQPNSSSTNNQASRKK